jgi:hypothetical protein
MFHDSRTHVLDRAFGSLILHEITHRIGRQPADADSQ